MNLELIDAPQAATGTHAATNLSDRQQQLTELIVLHNATLRSEAYSAFPDLLVFDADSILCTLTEAILSGRYKGPAEAAPFLRYAERFVRKEARRYHLTTSILCEHATLIRSAIRASLPAFIAERYVDNEDIFMEVVLLVFQRAHSLARRGPAKLTTRLWALTAKHVRFYYSKKWERRYRLNKARVESGLPFQGIPIMSTEELENMRTA